MSYSNLNIPALLIYGGSMQATCLGSYWDADRVGIMGPRQISDLKSVLSLTARKYRTDWLKWYGALSMRRQENDTIWNPFQIQTCGLPKANFQWLTWRGKEAQVNLPVFPAIKRQGRPLDQPLLFFAHLSKTAGGNVHLDRTPTSSSSSSFSWHQLQWVHVFVFHSLGI